MKTPLPNPKMNFFQKFEQWVLELVDESQKYVLIGSLKHLYIETTVQKDFSQKSILVREITFEK